MALSLPDLALERSSDVPLGTQLSWKLRAAIADGKLRPGDRLPGVRELAVAAGVNVNTVRAVYARLGEQGVIDSEHGRGTFVAQGRAGLGALGALAARTAQEARSHGLDPRDLAAILYGRFEEPLAHSSAPTDREAEARRGLRAEIEELERQLAVLEPLSMADDAAPGSGPGARLVSALELEGTRDELARRVVARRRELREARTRGARASQERQQERAQDGWPELRASGLRLVPGG